MEQDLTALTKLVEAGRMAEAEPGLVSFVEANPAQPVAQFYLGLLRLNQGRASEAEAAYRVAAKGLPGAAAAHSNLAIASRRNGNDEGALQAARRALLIAPQGVGPYIVCAELETAPETAYRIAGRAFCIDPGKQSGLLLGAAVRAGKREQADRIVKRLLNADLGDLSGTMDRALVLHHNGCSKEAALLYGALADRHPHDPEILFNLGAALIEAGDFEAAREPYARRARLIHGRPFDDRPDYDDLPAEPVLPVDRTCARHRLKHDAEQYRYLAEQGLLPEDLGGEWKVYQELLDGLGEEERSAIAFQLDDARYERIRRSYNRFVHIAASGWGEEDPLNPNLDWDGIEESYLDADPQAVAIDRLLTEDALARMRRFCFESTIWHAIKGAGYLGAYYRSGFNDPLLFAIGRGLRRRMPRVLGPHALKMMWAYKYDQHMSGINPHADFAAVNVNFWINHAESNLDPDSGGLLVFRKPPPKDWTFAQYNAAPASEIYEFLGEDHKKPIRVANRENRALLFDSRLFHETDRFSFREGYIHRRINITMLFGQGGL